MNTASDQIIGAFFVVNLFRMVHFHAYLISPSCDVNRMVSLELRPS
jgi:hypothetical protein